MKKTAFLLFVILNILSSSCSVIESLNPLIYDEHEKKMKSASKEMGFTNDYKPKYFTSPVSYSNILYNNNFHMNRGIYTKKNSPSKEMPVKIAWDLYVGKDQEGKEVAPDYAIILTPGSAGSYIQFGEYMYDIQKATGNKVAFFVMDHRGQGFSTWFNPKNKEGFNGLYVDDFDNYIKDLKYFYETIVKPRVLQMDLKYNKEIPVYIFGHSLGGGIAARYLQEYPDDFHGAILMSPAIKALHWIQRPFIYYGAYGIALYGGGSEYIPWGNDIHEELGFNSIFCFTYSQKRWKYWQKVSNPDYYNDESLIHPDSGGEVIRMSFPTFWWTYQLIKGTDPISLPQNAQKIKVPYLILVAGEEELVSVEAIDTFLLNTPNGLGKMVIFPKTKHDIMLAQDDTRNDSIKAIVEFLNETNRKTVEKKAKKKIIGSKESNQN